MLDGTMIRATCRWLLLGAALGVVASGPATAQGTPTAPTRQASQSALHSDIVTVFERLGKTLQAGHFSFKSRSLRAYAGPNGELLHIEHQIKTVVRRPDRLAVEVSGDDGATKLFYDGKTVTLSGADPKQYAQAQAPNTIGGLIDFLIDRLAVDMPLADLLVDNPSQSLLADIVSGGQVGTATIGGVKCQHLFFNQLPDTDLELWVEDNERALPRRVYIVYRSVPGRPNFVADLSDWDFTTRPADSEFVFQAPAGATATELKPRGATAPTPPK